MERYTITHLSHNDPEGAWCNWDDVAELEAILNRRQPWTLRDVLHKLADAADHLLHHHDCDCHGYEEIVEAREVARALALKIGKLGSADKCSAGHSGGER